MKTLFEKTTQLKESALPDVQKAEEHIRCAFEALSRYKLVEVSQLVFMRVGYETASRQARTIINANKKERGYGINLNKNV